MRPRDAGAAEGASGLVMIGKVIPKELGAAENEAGHEGLALGVRMQGLL